MICENVKRILGELPGDIRLIAAAKGRNPGEVLEAVNAGISIVGENYVQEAEEKIGAIGRKAEWHMLGNLQKNKVKKAVRLFDMIETVDSEELARKIDEECRKIDKVMPVLIELNVAEERQKSGVMPGELDALVGSLMGFPDIRLCGLMVMGPLLDNPQDLRPFFKEAKQIFDRIRSHYKDRSEWKYLSMGMSDSYKVAIDEGANMIRVGTAIFGPRSHEER